MEQLTLLIVVCNVPIMRNVSKKQSKDGKKKRRDVE